MKIRTNSLGGKIVTHLKQYLVDTNSIRYKVTTDDTNQKAARRFWSKAINEMQNGEAVILVPEAVVKELKHQSFSFEVFKNEKELENIADILSFSEVVPNITSDEIEELIISTSAYVTSKFREEIKEATNTSKLKYPGIPDARIICTAWQRNCVMVTGNIKDFVLLPLLEAPGEQKLYNIMSESFITLPEELYLKIHDDSTFQTMFQELVRKVETL
jgi:predicted nucleic acid-binding protein